MINNGKELGLVSIEGAERGLVKLVLCNCTGRAWRNKIGCLDEVVEEATVFFWREADKVAV